MAEKRTRRQAVREFNAKPPAISKETLREIRRRQHDREDRERRIEAALHLYAGWLWCPPDMTRH
jgi:hypothetical protein